MGDGTSKEFSELRNVFAKCLAQSLEFVRVDIRDEWPAELTAENYARGDVLCSGQFGSVVAARARPVASSFTHVEPRACVIKQCNVGARLEACLREEPALVPGRVKKLTRRIIMETYILNRLRHSNILHAHATVVDESNLMMEMVLPRFYPLSVLIDKYRREKDGEPMPIRTITMIVRQLCRALEFLHTGNIVHSDVQPDNIYVTRGGTVKLAHFSQARMLTSDLAQSECRTPIGREEFMCFEKQFNLRSASSLEQCEPYGTSADIWSVGVLVLHMVNYFPNEKWHRLPRNFALQMGEQKMPFKWMISEMMQLRVRLAQSGDERLKNFLSDKLLNVDARARATATQVLRSSIIKKWCFPELEQDKEYLVRSLVHDLDWPNRFRLEADGYNYDACEAKDIPAEFYWDDMWKELEKRQFGFHLQVLDGKQERPGAEIERHFSYADASLFEALMCAVEANELELFDIFAVDRAVRDLCFALMLADRKRFNLYPTYPACSRESTVALPPTLCCTSRMADVQVCFV